MCIQRYIPDMLWDVYVTGQRSVFWHVLCDELTGAEHLISAVTGFINYCHEGIDVSVL